MVRDGIDPVALGQAAYLAKWGSGAKTAATPAERDRLIQLSQPQQFSPSGYYPTAYRITWDEDQREYRIALTQLARR